MGRLLHIAAVPPSDTDENAVLFVDRQALMAVIDALRGIAEVDSFVLTTPPGYASPPLVLLRLLRTDVGLLQVEIGSEELALIGDAASLRELADELSELVAENDLDEPGMHTHIDRSWSPPPPWITDGSLPPIIAGWVPDGA